MECLPAVVVVTTVVVIWTQSQQVAGSSSCKKRINPCNEEMFIRKRKSVSISLVSNSSTSLFKISEVLLAIN